MNYNTNTASGNPASFATADNEPGIGVGAALSLTVMMGSGPADQSFAVTNEGGGTLAYAVTTNATWLSVRPVSGSGKTAGQSQIHTNYINVTGLAAGMYYGTNIDHQHGDGRERGDEQPEDAGDHADGDEHPGSDLAERGGGRERDGAAGVDAERDVQHRADPA